jgi:hypothetical protein
MAKDERMPPVSEPSDELPELNISLEKVCFIIVKAREFDAKVEPVEPDPGSNPGDDEEREVLEDYADDATAEELSDAIDGLNDDEIVDLVALTWLGRGDFTKESWEEARQLAAERHRRHSAAYLTGMPELADHLEEGLDMLGYSCADYDADHL